MKITFKVSDLKSLIGEQTSGNILITVGKDKKPTAEILTTVGTAPTIEGCPYPPGCTE